MKSYFLFAGEASGDLHGSRLIQTLRKEEKIASIYGVGGPHMRQEDFDCLIATEKFQVMGFSDVLLALPHLCKLFYQVRNLVLKTKPDYVILIDYPGFNLRLARALRKQGFKGKLIQYVCPTIWAHGTKRIQILNAYYDLLLTIFPFEATYFSNTKLKVEYVGNPLLETIQNYHYCTDWHLQIGIENVHDLIALFSRQSIGRSSEARPSTITDCSATQTTLSSFTFCSLLCSKKFTTAAFRLYLQKSFTS